MRGNTQKPVLGGIDIFLVDMIALTLFVGLTDTGGKHMLPLQINIDAVKKSSIFLEVISSNNSHTVFFKYTH